MRRPFVTKRIKRLVGEVGAELKVEPRYKFVGHITFPNGVRTFFRDTSFNINGQGSVQIAKDKGYTSFFLKDFGFEVPEWYTVFNEELNSNLSKTSTVEEGLKACQKIGFPVILKPNDKSKGEGVFKVYNEVEYRKSATEILRSNYVLLIQEFCVGNDYRIVVLDDEIIAAYQRIPLRVTGDGNLSILDLLVKKQSEFHSMGRETIIPLNDERIKQTLSKQNLELNSILPKNETVQLLDISNLSTGGTAVDVSDTIHEEFKNLALSIADRMCLRFCGVDILTEDITSPANDYKVIEVNSSPGLDNYGFLGKQQDKKVDDLYLSILRKLEKV